MNTLVLRRLVLFAVSVASMAWGKTDVFEQLSDRSLWQYTGTPCQGNVCSGWVEVDSGNNTLYAATGGGTLYQMRNDFSIWAFSGPACTPPSQGLVCAGWEKLDNNPNTAMIFVGNGVVFQAHIDGSVWVWTGQTCNGGSCPGWAELDNNGNALAFNAGLAGLYELRTGGQLLQYVGPSCGSYGCPGWTQIDSNPNTVYATAGSSAVYQLHNTGAIWQYVGPSCSGNFIVPAGSYSTTTRTPRRSMPAGLCTRFIRIIRSGSIPVRPATKAVAPGGSCSTIIQAPPVSLLGTALSISSIRMAPFGSLRGYPAAGITVPAGR